MREILFRGKCNDSKEWIYGNLLQIPAFNFYSIESHQVYKDTIGQYTGLIDKNGNKIFEGDILKICYDAAPWEKEEEWEIKYARVFFEDGCFKLDEYYSSDGYNELACVYREFVMYGDNTFDVNVIFNVIGNIYDTPKLLETI